MREHRLANLRREITRTRDTVHRSHLEYELCRELLEQAIADAEASHERLVERLVRLDRHAELTGRRLWAQRRYEPPAAPRRRQRSSTTISVAHATAS